MSDERHRLVVITPPARRDLRKLPADQQDRVITAVLGLTEQPKRGDFKKLEGAEAEWRLRVGPWRVRFMFGSEGRIVVLRVVPRGRAYRD